jgi:2-polyprenyl-6-methoxyphenol hydroxylase-like FAD-dependent oxidoreductase
MSHSPVLVVGAGPVGLAAAVALAQSGVAVRIIDRLAEPTNQSRAAIVHARTLEHFERLGFAGDFLAAGVKVHGVVVYAANQTVLTRATLDGLPTAYPFMLGLEQFETERLLTARLRQAGVEIERGIELTSLLDAGDHVAATLRDAHGTETTENFSYVLGADGAHSSVRAALGLHLEGETLDTTWITADVKIRWDRDPGEAVSCLTPDGIAFIAAMNEGRWRVIVSAQKMTAEQAAALTLADVQTLVNARLGADVPLYDPVWISGFGINTRMTSTMSRGRIFLAGDAAHVHSPIGGQGMNTGIQDALNLAWKLALVLDGTASPALLDSFDAERHANAKRLLAGVGPLTKIANLRQPVAIEIRNHLIQLVSHLGLNRNAPRSVSMLDVGYPQSPAVFETHLSWSARGPRAGERAPDASGLLDQTGEHRLFELWAGDARHQLLVFLDEPAEVAFPASPLYRLLKIVRAGVPGDGVVVDAHGEAHEAYEARAGACYLVRPDGIIAYRSGDADPAALREYLAKWYPGA